MKYLILIPILILLACFPAHAQSDTIPSFVKDSLDNYITKAMKDWEIPGMSVCIVKNGKPVLIKGYGVKELGKTDPVDENTLFTGGFIFEFEFGYPFGYFVIER